MIKKRFLTIFLGLIIIFSPIYSQVTIGADYAPQKFSVLELISNNTRGLRLPQIRTTDERNAISDAYGSKEEMHGLTIFNLQTHCWETWNGLVWISLCAPPPTLIINPDTLIFTAAAGGGGPQNVTVTTSQSGWTITRTVAWTTTSGEGTGTLTVSVPNTVYTGSDVLIDSIKITTTDGLLTKTIVVIRLPDVSNITDSPITPGANIYVGAFWRVDQTGERLISISNYPGEWTATVISGVEWITLDNAMTNDINYAYYPTGTPNESLVDSYETNPNFDRDHKVGGGLIVSGTADATSPIYFRIGLNGKFTDSPKYDPNPNFINTFPARYGVVLLTYGGGKTQRIWIRQGHEADYLMREGDPNGSNVAVADNRSFARRFSPYNLTDPNNGAPTDYLGTGGNVLTVGGGDFVKYPSQAGYFFRWNYNRVAFNPVIPAPPTNITGWTETNQDGVEFWNSANDETCPPTYRRPTDGNNNNVHTTGAVTQSEIRQSLWLNPPTGMLNNSASDGANNVWGYYADGFFDRRKIGNSPNGTALTAVSTANNSIAYIGRLFFNPNSKSYASVFFPAAGNRNSNGSALGALTNDGKYGYYWPSTSSSASISYYLNIGEIIARFGNGNRGGGMSIRCVKQ